MKNLKFQSYLLIVVFIFLGCKETIICPVPEYTPPLKLHEEVILVKDKLVSFGSIEPGKEFSLKLVSHPRDAFHLEKYQNNVFIRTIRFQHEILHENRFEIDVFDYYATFKSGNIGDDYVMIELSKIEFL